MGKANDKKVVRESARTLTVAIGNMLESERERKYRYAAKPKPLPRQLFCKRHGLNKPAVDYIESGRMLQRSISSFRKYFAVLRKNDDKSFLASFKKVCDGLKELEKLLKQF